MVGKVHTEERECHDGFHEAAGSDLELIVRCWSVRVCEVRGQKVSKVFGVNLQWPDLDLCNIPKDSSGHWTDESRMMQG